MTAWTYIRKNTCTSTNDVAKALPPYSVISTCHQTNGRGRMGRVWEDAKGNLKASIVLPKPKKNAHLYTFLISLAVAKTLSQLSPKIKWPNDILIDGKKVCGILLEATQNSLIIGIGINVVSVPKMNALYPVTCLKDCHFNTTDIKLLKSILQNFDSVLEFYHKEGFKPVRHEWLSFACGLNKPISVNLPYRTIQGIFKGISDIGALMLETKDAQMLTITAGDVFLIKD